MEVFRMVLFMALVGVVASRGVPISEEVFVLGGSGSSSTNIDSSMMQLESQDKGLDCPVDFASQNYTIITSQCKAPDYNATLCCSAFKEFACPIAVHINDVKNNNCASTMFKYIHSYGKYQPGVFSSKCKESKLGLSCRDNTLH